MTRLLFICDGNTCRSALAEGMARARLGPGSGILCESAGLDAVDGAPAASLALRVAGEAGVDLSGHRSRPVDRETLRAADRIYAMTRSQVEAIVRAGAVSGHRVALLDPAGEDIGDPHGGELAAYRAARDRIAQALETRLGEWRSAED